MKTNKKIEEILDSLDGIKRASPDEFFYTRLKARMENEMVKMPAPRPVLLKPVWALSALTILLIINAAVIFNKSKTPESTASTESETLQSIAADYNINDVSSLYDLNEQK
ncbi:MAG: hypothetical protein U0U70_01925 [Chitinophagaceae bacterium]